ncbi:MAG TPA: PEP/pyruvate-binding domain-containing protein, partial [Acidimicrobiales bacterium]|nr:PEP/pyruvate-binding domain-containing protein [Acidimicrobiales bacterium]
MRRGDTLSVGGKGANLGELIGAGLPVPPGFVVTAGGYLEAMEAAGVRDDLMAGFGEALAAADDPGRLSQRAEELRALVRKAGVPQQVAAAVLEAYHRLGADVPVAVRSSATAEDAEDTSFAGMHDTFANVVGDRAVLDRLADCWASLYGERVISYRVSRGLTGEPAIAVVVQRLVPSDRAGVLFTADPATGDRDRLVVEAAFGLGEVVVGGEVEPDTYTFLKEGPHLVQARIGHKD